LNTKISSTNDRTEASHIQIESYLDNIKKSLSTLGVDIEETKIIPVSTQSKKKKPTNCVKKKLKPVDDIEVDDDLSILRKKHMGR